MICPQIHEMAGQLGAIVGEQVFGRAALANKPIQRLDVLAAQALTNVYRQALPAEHVHDGKGAQLLTIAKLVSPDSRPRWVAWVGIALAGAPPSCDAAAFWPATPGLPRGKADRPDCARPSNRRVSTSRGRVDSHNAGGFAQSHACAAGSPTADPACSAFSGSIDAGASKRRPVARCSRDTPSHRRQLHERRPGNFFDRTSCRTALSKLSSATSFFSPALSSESGLN